MPRNTNRVRNESAPGGIAGRPDTPGLDFMPYLLYNSGRFREMEYFPMKKAIRILIPVMLALFILVSIFWYLFDYDRVFTRDTLLGQARFNDLHGNSRLSSWFYGLAYDFSGHAEDVAVELANQYRADNNFTKAEATLTNAIRSGPSADLYAALCETYVAQNKLMDAIRLLDGITDPAIAAEIDARRPTAPSVDSPSGYYSQYIDIHLTSSGSKIYYTTDADYPSTEGPVYQDAISLPTGETTIMAISVSEDGLVSPMTTLNYTITGVVEEVTFVDEVVESYVRQLIQAGTSETLYTNQLWDITEFTAPENASVFVDLSLLPNLEKLTIQNHTIESLDFLSSLTSLKTLDLTGCRMPTEALSVLAQLPALTDLTLSDCALSTIAPLMNAPNLTRLDLSHNTIRNLEALAPMSTLVELDLQHNALTDLSVLGSLKGLEKLHIGYNSISDLSPISGCGGLRWLDASNNYLTQLGPIASLPLLEYLSVEYNQLTDVSVLGGCTGLTELHIASNTITDIASLSTLTKLEIFDFSSNQVSALPAWPEGCALRTIDGSYNAISSIDVLKNMQSLAYVYMDYNLLTNIDAIADNYCLVQVNVFGNQISDVSKLREHDIIVNYDPTVS